STSSSGSASGSGSGSGGNCEDGEALCAASSTMPDEYPGLCCPAGWSCNHTTDGRDRTHCCRSQDYSCGNWAACCAPANTCVDGNPPPPIPPYPPLPGETTGWCDSSSGGSAGICGSACADGSNCMIGYTCNGAYCDVPLMCCAPLALLATVTTPFEDCGCDD